MTLTDLQPFTTERVWTVEGIPVLTARLSVPEPLSAEDRISRRIRRYYRLQLRAYLRYCESFLLPRAEAEFRAALAASTPLPSFRAELDHTITYREGSLLSLCIRSRESVPQGSTRSVWRGDTWDLTDGYPVPLSAFFPPRSSWKRALTAYAETELRRREEQGAVHPRDGLRRLLRRHFNPRSYYLTPEGLVFFYPAGSIAPAAEGILSFTVPYGELDLHTPAEAKEPPPF